eukprot:gnl/MRDRNA2_/MRDRNA2_68058_c0_seq1.p1 gnl/MRDRNA2_/MRDRNA2_68058_c0~~gnl/MRDRNA2_/MRDRNA2_68058_c0_seq1.p1  ORF type:complete len:305 (+),score=33.38 gnl/MRDRNA2_/MRDRNA2_68058_c0_seq1:39-953(+)
MGGSLPSSSCHCHATPLNDEESGWNYEETLHLGYPRRLPESLRESAHLLCNVVASGDSLEWCCLYVTDAGSVCKVQLGDNHLPSSDKSCCSSKGTSTSSKERFQNSKSGATFRFELYNLPSSVDSLFVVGIAGDGQTLQDAGDLQALLCIQEESVSNQLGVYKRRELRHGNVLALVGIFLRYGQWWVQAIGKAYRVNPRSDVELPRDASTRTSVANLLSQLGENGTSSGNKGMDTALERMVHMWLEALADPTLHENELALGKGRSSCTPASCQPRANNLNHEANEHIEVRRDDASHIIHKSAVT